MVKNENPLILPLIKLWRKIILPLLGIKRVNENGEKKKEKETKKNRKKKGDHDILKETPKVNEALEQQNNSEDEDDDEEEGTSENRHQNQKVGKNSRMITRTIEIYENQRWWIGIGWCPLFFPTERQNWSDEKGNPLITKDTPEFPEEGKNLGPWRIDVERTGDNDGWEYGSRAWDHWKQTPGIGYYTRRRKWVRAIKELKSD